MEKVRWGILSTAKIGRQKVIPAMQNSQLGQVVAIASRNIEKANTTAADLHIEKAFGSYEELLASDEIDAVYIPLPNHMHVEWAIKALEAGKHVLCEKPIGLSAAEAEQLQNAASQYPKLKVMEAFMYRFHPQWHKAKSLLTDGRIGTLLTIQSFFSYYNVDMDNIRNQKDAGGGALMDIGCYCISFARFLFESEPLKVVGLINHDPLSGTDKLTSAMLQFAGGSSTFTCSTQLMPYQRVNVLGTEGRIEIEIPCNAPPGEAVNIWLHTKDGSKNIVIEAADQYLLQCDAFARSIIDDTPVPTALSDAINNMKVIEAVFESADGESWVSLI